MAVRFEGIDVSHYEPRVDWQAVKQSGRSYAMAKATEGLTQIDAMFVRHRFGARAVGLPLGAYHFGHPGEDPVRQAERFSDAIGPLRPGELLPWLDLEIHGQAGPVDVLDWTVAFLVRADALFGIRLGLYTGHSFWFDFMGDPDPPALRDRPLWVARYGADPPRDLRVGPWAIWQYSDGQAGHYTDPVPGAGRVDKNVCRIDLSTLTVAA